MPAYDDIAGQSVERLAALSGGVCVAMTLLLLELHAPAREAIHTEHDLLRGMAALSPELLVYLLSFLTLGILWVGQQTQLNHIGRSNRNFTWIHLAFLFAVTLMPFSTRLLSEFVEHRAALIAYWANILLLGLILYLSWGCATSNKLLREDIATDVPPAIGRRILTGQAFCAFGALLCFFNVYYSVAFIVLVQFSFAVGPHFRHLPESSLQEP
jgi:TMEM175 potassium channel family protein